MSDWLGAGFLVAGFLACVRLLGLVEANRHVITITSESLGVMGNSSLGDDEKERRLRRHALRLFGQLVVISAGGAAAVLVPTGVIWALDRLGWLSLTAVTDTALSAPFIVATSIAAAVAFAVLPRRTGRAATARYSPAEQLVHRVAFSTVGPQKVAAGVEDRLWRRRLAGIAVDRPVFITALPRAGTTLLLERCARVPELASHTYRDMPFVLSPVAWHACSRAFRVRGERRERAHGDGVLIDFDSPEAFEEMVWKAFWPGHYAAAYIVLWTAAMRDPRFEAFLAAHMRKIVLLRRGPGAGANGARYVSKNNLNISRLPLLRAVFPAASILVPFRDPLEHAISLQRQHARFLVIQREDPFTIEYMRETGHYDFGETLRPIDFDGWLAASGHRNPAELGFWLEYWTVAYEHLLADDESRPLFVDYDALCARPAVHLRAVAEAIGLERPESLVALAHGIRPQAGRATGGGELPDSLLARARDVHARLKVKAGV